MGFDGEFEFFSHGDGMLPKKRNFELVLFVDKMSAFYLYCSGFILLQMNQIINV
jgi:hypothetical protein